MKRRITETLNTKVLKLNVQIQKLNMKVEKKLFLNLLCE